MAKKQKVAYQDRLAFGDSEVFFQLVKPDGYTIELIESEMDAQSATRPNYTTARVALLQRAVHKLNVDGEEINLEPDARGRSNFPYITDGEQTLTTYLLRVVVNNIAPELAEQFEDCFGKYLNDEPEDAGFTAPSGRPLKVAEGE